jgi:hypothetical protein
MASSRLANAKQGRYPAYRYDWCALLENSLITAAYVCLLGMMAGNKHSHLQMLLITCHAQQFCPAMSAAARVLFGNPGSAKIRRCWKQDAITDAHCRCWAGRWFRTLALPAAIMTLHTTYVCCVYKQRYQIIQCRARHPQRAYS